MGAAESPPVSPTLPRSLEDVTVTKFNLREVPHDPLVLVCNPGLPVLPQNRGFRERRGPTQRSDVEAQASS